MVLVSLFLTNSIVAQSVPSNQIITIEDLSSYLKDEVKTNFKNKVISTSELAYYFREKFSERYFYDWKNFENRFQSYKTLYPEAEIVHTERALDHMFKYNGSTQWKLPFNYLFGEPINAYALRHLARQHKMLDIAFYYNYKNQDAEYLNYFKNQLKSLNTAFVANEFETIEDGNGVYEAFRSGYRVLNWLQIHNMFLGQENYSDEDQLITIATLLQHASHLYKTNKEFHAGNHQTRGLSALAMTSILLRDFEGTEIWYSHAMKLLEEHLAKEINDDGFQFERTIHYHISDIGNYYYVYQLAKISNLNISEFWETKLKSLFTTLIKVAYPDKSAPVLSDDTDTPWAEKNDISGALTLGYLLFEDSEMGYFANNYVDAKMFWYLSDSQLKMLDNIETKKPEYGSLEFSSTGYYIMRDGWNANDNMMIISAGLDDKKPDHQHGDMLGIQAMANGKVVLPNYQVRYYLKDLELFKNSMTKNVALVDNELQGKQYTSNKGGSGFGKFRKLPNPKVIAWKSNNHFDLFVGSHDGFENIGVSYTRQVIYVKDDFWIVKDNFSSDDLHNYKQVWQGHYSLENEPNLLRSTFNNGSGLDIFQINKIDEVETSGKRGKQWSVVSKKDREDFSFITILYPFSTYDKCLDIVNEKMSFGNWSLNNSDWDVEGDEVISLSNEDKSMFFSVKSLEKENIKIEFSVASDVFVTSKNNGLTIQSLSDKETQIIISEGKTQEEISLHSGQEIKYEFK
jgi:hypothetical protein